MSQSITVIITYPIKNKVYNIEIEPQTKVQELIDEFQEMLHPNAQEKVVFYFGGVALDNEMSFDKQGIRKGSQIELRVERVGGFDYLYS